MGTVRNILQIKGHSVFSVSPDITVYEGLEKLVEKRVGALMVTDAEGNYLGTFTERDYSRKVILKGRSSKETLIKEIMDKHPILTEDTSLEDCMKMMAEKKFRHFPVVDGTGKLTGVISIGDVVEYIINEKQFIIDNLQNYIMDTHHH